MNKHVVSVFILIVLVSSLTIPSFGSVRNIQIPSDSTGEGNLAVQVTYPDSPANYRYQMGSPVLVFSPGGHEPGSLSAGGPFEEFGFTVISFLYPGGSQGPYSSDGVYDYRGPNCVIALRDVIRYALGTQTDIMGNSINDLIPGQVLTSNTGIIAGSNGGPTATAALSIYSVELQEVKYVVYLESPTNDQTVNGDLGNVGYDCDTEIDGDGNGLPRDDGKNVNYTEYGLSSCTVDYSNLAFDPVTTATYQDPADNHSPVIVPGIVFLDNNGNGTVDSIGSPPCYDTNYNNVLDPFEDYPFSGKITFTSSGDPMIFLSTEVTDAAETMGIFPGEWPDHIATSSSTAQFWSLRDSTLHFSNVATSFPELGILIVFTESDHVQCADDHPHIQQCYDGYQNQGTWCRLNPDETYIELVMGSIPQGTVDNSANISVIPGDMKQYSNPESVEGFVAGACEMADRVQYNHWSENLDGVLNGSPPTPSPTWTPSPSDLPPLYVVSMMHAEESLPFHQDQELFENYATALRELSQLFASHGAKLEFGPDWTFIEGVKIFDSTLLTDLLQSGHGIQTHAHESRYNLGEVNALLAEAGVIGNSVGNGGFLQSGSGGTNWAGYIVDFRKDNREQLFQVSVGYKNPETQEIKGLGFAFRPSLTGDWTDHDPGGPLIYLGNNMPPEEGGGLDFETIRQWMDDVLTRVDPDKVNTMYWHDSLHRYSTPEISEQRYLLWEQLLTDYFDRLVSAGRIEWKTFTEMAEIYTDWEKSHCGDTGVSIRMPYPEFVAGDPCWCHVDVCINESSPLIDYPLFVILDVFGSLYFAPDFSSYDNYLELYSQFSPGLTTVEILPEFVWPEGVGSAMGIQWIAALTNPEITQITGNVDFYTFGWSE